MKKTKKTTIKDFLCIAAPQLLPNISVHTETSRGRHRPVDDTVPSSDLFRWSDLLFAASSDWRPFSQCFHSSLQSSSFSKHLSKVQGFLTFQLRDGRNSVRGGGAEGGSRWAVWGVAQSTVWARFKMFVKFMPRLKVSDVFTEVQPLLMFSQD